MKFFILLILFFSFSTHAAKVRKVDPFLNVNSMIVAEEKLQAAIDFENSIATECPLDSTDPSCIAVK